MRPHPNRRLALLVLAVVLLAGAVLASQLAIADGAKHGKPRLTLTSRDPATVHGAGFKPRRRVRVTMRAGSVAVRRPVASGRGTFTAHFSMAIDRCTVWSVSASQHGKSAVLRSPPKPECAPAGTP
jgi:hypothetical protein